MSALYNLEPQPTAKVILKTTSGDLLLELWSKQTPLASRNFLQHCLDGYYNNTIFHRLVAGFIIQGGDPTGTGHGGESALNRGQPFEDEIHSRLKFNRRGLLGMANEGEDSNGSQFFLTLGATPELQGKHTMFGRIEGDTVYNLMKMSETEMVEEGGERPLYPTKVTGAEILVNPFEDMVARVKEAPRTRDEAGKKEIKKRKKPAGKNVLSFGGEEGEEEAAPVLKKVKANPKLVSVGQEEPEKLNNAKMPEAPPVKQREKRKERVPSPEADEEPEVVERAQPVPVKKPTDDLPHEDEDDEEDGRPSRSKSTLDATNAEIAALKASMKRTIDTAPREKERPKNALEAMIPTTSTRGRRRGKATDEKGAFDLFKSFKTRLEDLPPDERPATIGAPAIEPSSATNGHSAQLTTTEAVGAVDEEAELCDLHFIANCQSCQSWDQDKPDAEANEDGDDDPGWMAHQLTFAKDLLGKDLEWKRKMAEIEVIDPREKARALKEERRKDKGKEREKSGGMKGKR